MHRFTRYAALAALTLIVQMLGTGIAAAQMAPDPGDCDFDRDSLELTIGDADPVLQIEDDGMLYCYPGGAPSVKQRVSTIDSITVVMDDDDSTGELSIYLDDNTYGGGSGNVADWPKFDTFDIDVTTTVWLDGHDIYQTNSANALHVTIGAKTISFGGTTATSNAPRYYVDGSEAPDRIDGSKATVRLEVHGGDGDDVIRGGAGRDKLYGDDDFDLIYGGAGDDLIDCDRNSDPTEGDYETGWGGPGDDQFVGCGIAGPGAGDDVIEAYTWLVTYADLTGGIEFSQSDDEPSGYVTTGGAAGDDEFEGTINGIVGSQGDDVIFSADDYLWVEDGSLEGMSVDGLGGDDVIKVDYDETSDAFPVQGGAGDDLIVDVSGTDEDPNTFYGGPGDDALKGKGGEDLLSGGNGRDQAWGGNDLDTCGAEVLDRCEYLKRQSA